MSTYPKEAQLAERVRVKPLDEDDYEEIISAAAINMRKATSGIRGQVATVQDSIDWWVMKETERRILAALEATPSAPKVTDEMVQAAWVRASEMSAGTTMANKSALREVLKAALTAAGFRIVGPGEVDPETVERCAEVVEEDNRTPLAKQSGHIPAWLKYARDRAAALRAMGEEQS